MKYMSDLFYMHNFKFAEQCYSPKRMVFVDLPGCGKSKKVGKEEC